MAGGYPGRLARDGEQGGQQEEGKGDAKSTTAYQGSYRKASQVAMRTADELILWSESSKQERSVQATSSRVVLLLAGHVVG